MNVLIRRDELVEKPDDYLQPKTADEVFDAIEPILYQLEDECKALALQAAAGDNVSSCIRKLSMYKQDLAGLNSFWKFLQNDTNDTYYVDSHFGSLSWLTPADYWFKEHIYVPIKVNRHKYSTKLTLEKGAIVVDELCEEMGYRPLSISQEVYDNHSELDAYQEHVNHINRDYRIFKCKSCGVITCSSHAYDEGMLKRGLSPVQRCESCRVSRRVSRAEQTHLF